MINSIAAAPVHAITLRVEPAVLKLSLEPAGAVSVDAQGRWLTARVGDTLLRRKSDSGITLVAPDQRVSDLPCDSPWHGAPTALVARALALLVAWGPCGEAPAAWEPRSPAAPALRLIPDSARLADALERLAAALAWTPARFAVEGARFAEAYPEPVPILPPDRTRDIAVLPAVGCPHGRCRFCSWYSPGSFRALAATDFARHLGRVAALCGRRMGNRTGLFLGSASAFSLRDETLCRAIDLAGARLGPFPRGVAGFLDPDHAPRRSAVQWQRLASAGVARVVVGLETGHPAIRESLGKSRDLTRLRAAVDGMRASGIGAGVTVLAGPGGADAAEPHLAATVAFVASLRLGPADLVYVSPLVEAAAGSGEPGRCEPFAEAQAERLADAIRRAGTPKVTPYRVDRFRYFAS